MVGPGPTAKTGEDGKFRFCGLHPGVYRITAVQVPRGSPVLDVPIEGWSSTISTSAAVAGWVMFSTGSLLAASRTTPLIEPFGGGFSGVAWAV